MKLLRDQGFLAPVEHSVPRKWHLPKAGHPGDPKCISRVRNVTECGRGGRERGRAADLLAGGSRP